MKTLSSSLQHLVRPLRTHIQKVSLLAVLLVSVLTLTAASPIESRPDAIAVTPTLGNYPNTSVPLSTDTTVTPDVAPTNAARMNVSTSTSFKGKLEGNPATGVVRVTDAHPAGTYTVTVRAFDTGGLSATKTFMLTVTTPLTCNPLTFVPVAPVAAGTGPGSAAVGDFNGDGKQDLVVTNFSSNTASIILGDGAGHFGAATSFTTGAGTNPNSVAVGDFNGDGKQDLAVANFNSFNVSILLGNGAGGFSAPTSFGVGADSVFVAVGDFNGDGRQDLALSFETDYVSVMLGDGAGNFGASTNFSAGAGGQTHAMVVGDFNGDGKQDLAVANINPHFVSVLLGNGAGSFGAPTTFSTGNTPVSLAVGDFNGDGKQDLAATCQASAAVQIWVGTGTGSFTLSATLATGVFFSRPRWATSMATAIRT